ncbi:K Homology domain, type 1 [Ostreococcus tauri]|uniref:K Homology domain, type 1 n=1 Tax=Ostreococcus tauri TaxID=70448 RepID=Q01GR7_OSTTA|nr:K Homology domain, type 1 [Ostreococcus tauri]CAL50077.1 K Homology domain, type 1 [Ostreococcus tauri]|eukprot:XP_003074225.1 K Homology domain, type 1 [Ostreococcus tauri]
MAADADAATAPALGTAVFRVLCAETRVGGLIGRQGKRVRGIVTETGAQVKVLASTARCHERAVLIFAPRARDGPGDTCAAREGARRVVRYLTRARAVTEDECDGARDESEDESDDDDDGRRGDGVGGQDLGRSTAHVTLRLLVPAGQAGHLIGKGGENIQEVRKRANGAHVAVQEVGQVPPCATSEDRVVEIHGKPKDVRVAADAVFESLKDYLVDSSVLGHYQPTVAAPAGANVGDVGATAMGIGNHPMSAPMGMAPVGMAPVGMAPGTMMIPVMPMMTQMQPGMQPAGMPPVHDSVEIDGEKVANVLGEHGANISTIAQISGCQVSLIETNPDTNLSEVELSGPHESNIAAAKSLVRAFAEGEMMPAQAFQPGYPMYMPMPFPPQQMNGGIGSPLAPESE